MKTYILFWLCCGFSALSFGQSITNIEYYFNTDPGFGNGTTVSANTNSGDLTQTLNISVPNNATGFNTLFIRTQDDSNVWSLYDKAIFFITDFNPADVSDEITAVEYFFNTDPGFGNATAITVDANTGNLDQNLLLPLPTDMVGFNTIYIRVQDDFGVWSLYDNAIFFATDFDTSGGAETISAIEYFIDTDPGFGNANSISVATNTGDVNQTASIPLGTLSEGFHNLYLRTQDDLGAWSLYDKRLFFVTPEQTVSPIVSAEYFYDTDPGFGNGTSVALVPTGNLDEFTVDLSTVDVSCDFHDFYIRLINANGAWSLYDYGLQIEVFDNASPTIVTFPNITAELDATGQASITLEDVNNGTFDDCQLVSVALNQTQFDYDCNDLGANTVTITAIDAEDKTSTEEVTITVVDLIDPVAISQNLTLQLDANGTVSTSGIAVDNGSTDNCAIANRSLDKTTFDCDDLGDNTVILTVTDTYGNTNTTTAIITIEDTIAPTAVTQNATISLGGDGTIDITAAAINQSTDNCNIVSSAIDLSSFDCNDLGENTITLTVEDQSGNTDTATAIVTIIDDIDPVAIPTSDPIVVELDQNGEGSLFGISYDAGSTDNCDVVLDEISPLDYTCDDLGVVNATFEVFDASGNMGTAPITVTVVDNINPVALGQDITVDLGGNASVSISANDVDNGSNDNCGNVTLNIDQDTFTQTGMFPIEITVTDSSGNIDTVTVIVTVTDTTLSLTENELQPNSIIVYPNPSERVIHISTEQIIDNFSVVDVRGRVLGNFNGQTTTIDISSWSSGIYFMKFRVANSEIIKQIIKR